MTPVEALTVAVIVLAIVSVVLALILAAVYRTRPVIQRRAPVNGELDDIDLETTGIRQMRKAMKLVKPRKKIALGE